MKYSFNINNNNYERIEKNDASLLVVKPMNHQIVLNKTGKQIFDMLKYFSSSEELLVELQKLYPSMDQRLLNKDLNEVLSVMDIYSIITLDEAKKEVTKVDDCTHYKIIGDINYKEVSRFLIESIEDGEALKFLQEKNGAYYSPMSLRLRVVGNYEYGVYATKNNIIQSYMTISATPAIFSTVISVTSVVFCSNLSNEEMKKHIQGMLNRLLHVISITKPFRKLRFSFCNDEDVSALKDIIEGIGFAFECRLKDETENGDLTMYSLCI